MADKINIKHDWFTKAGEYDAKFTAQAQNTPPHMLFVQQQYKLELTS